MKKLRIGIVGLGRVASKTHIPVLKTLDQVEIAAGAESNFQRAERVKKLFSLKKVYTDYLDMYQSERLDGAYISLPSFLHKDACIKALENGIHVLCEKPMGMSVEEAEEITSLAEEKGLTLMPGYKNRYAGNFLKAKTMIDEGILGQIIHVQGTYVTPGPYISWDPKSDWYLDERYYGVIYDSGCHLVDLLFYLVPCEVLHAKTVSAEGFKGYTTPTNLCCIFATAEGIIGDLTIGWRGAIDILSLSIHGTAGSVIVSRETITYLNPGTDPVDKINLHLKNVFSNSATLLEKIRDKVAGKNFYPEDLTQAITFCNSISGKQNPPVNGRDAVRIHKLLALMIS